MNRVEKLGLVLMAIFFSTMAGFAQVVVSDTITNTKQGYWEDKSDSNSRVLNKSQFGDNWFFGIHGGGTFNWGADEDFSGSFKQIRPMGALSLGKWLSPYVALRANVSLAKNTATYDAGANPKWWALGGGLDGMFNFTNLFCGYKESRSFNFVGILGFGTEHVFDYKNNVVPDPKGWLLTGRLGLMSIWRLSEAWDLTVEATNHWLDDSYDGLIENNRYDGHFNLMLGFVYRFKNHDGSHEFTYARRDWNKYDVMNQEINRLRQKAAADRAYAAAHPNINTINSKQINTLISFAEGSSEIDKLQEVNVYTAAEAMKELNNADLYITVLGKATKNADLFIQRAQSIRDSLTKDYNIPAGRIYIEKDPALVESLDKSTDYVIMYINE